MKKQIGFKTKGMNQDLSVSAFNPEFSFENRNLRLSTNEGNTLLSWVNERGTKQINTNVEIKGTPIGTAVINSQLVIFTHAEEETDGPIKPDWYKRNYTNNTEYLLLKDSSGKKVLSASINGTYTVTVPPVAMAWDQEPSPFPLFPIDYRCSIYFVDNNGTYFMPLWGLLDAFNNKDNVIIENYYSAFQFTQEVLDFITRQCPSDNEWHLCFEENEEYTPWFPEFNLYYGTETFIGKWFVYNYADRHWYFCSSLDNITTEETRIEEHGKDGIYVLKKSEDLHMTCKCLFAGNLNFDIEHPLETLVSYESELIQKVYWVDGKNQPRLINLGGDLDNIDTSFDFVSTLQLKEIVSVQKSIGSEGMFAPGVIQYAFTYISKNGQESNIFYTTPLYYISYLDRGASPEDKVSNSFTIEIKNADANFDLLRIYSIQRTSIDGTPFCKRLQDISLKDYTVDSGIITDTISYTDTGLNGDTVDPTELQYKGGETIIAKTMEQKDNTLFFGNFSIKRELFNSELSSKIKDGLTNNIESAHRTIKCVSKDNGSDFYRYCNQLSSTQTQNGVDTLVSCGGFKKGENYRLGVQFQNETGKWSDPIFIDDFNESKFPTVYTDGGVKYDEVVLAGFKATLSDKLTKELPASYKKVRPLVVFPNISDRHIICQGIAAPTVYTDGQRGDNEKPGNCYAQSSWFFRPYISTPEWSGNSGDPAPEDDKSMNTALVYPTSHNNRQLPLVSGYAETYADPRCIRKCETNGYWGNDKRFKVDRKICTLHSPEIEFDESIPSIDFTGMEYQSVGSVSFDVVASDIDLQVNGIVRGTGFNHRSFINKEGRGLCAGIFYGGWIMDDDVLDWGGYGALPYPDYQTKEIGFFVFPWQRDGSINNDCQRDGRLDVLKKKVLSNLRYSNPGNWQSDITSYSTNVQLFNSDEITITKINGKPYQGNYQNYVVDDWEDGTYFTCGTITDKLYGGWSFIDGGYFKTGATADHCGFWYCNTNKRPEEEGGGLYGWTPTGDGRLEVGETNVGLILERRGTHIEYKSTPHIVFERNDAEVNNPMQYERERGLSIVEVVKEVNPNTIFGGKSIDALKANIWIPCGEPVTLGCDGRTGKATEKGSTVFYYDYGDTYYQRFDCLKTYPFTLEDQNQIIEIGSFMVETRQNIDGRYDRNRGQTNNLYMYPGKNFNLMNPVYSQLNNFFTYRIQDEDAYKDTNYPNYIMWSKTKENGAISDLWTNITMASTLALDGDKGEITSLQRLNNNLICFQDRGISRIQYMENVQVASTQGVPIEIANSDKVRGKDYISNTIGCSNKWSIVSTPAGIYFMDSNEKSIYRLGEGLQNISQQGGFNSWCKQNIPSPEVKWNPSFPENNLAFVGYYDHKNQDVLYINRNTALAFSEKLGAFTSFYDYGSTPWFCVLNDTGVWVRGDGTLWQHQAGEYCNFFDEKDEEGNIIYKPYSMTLVGNPEPQMDKIFTNLEFRASVEGDGEQTNAGKFNFYLPFDSLETWNEYQHGLAKLDIKNGHAAMKHHTLDNEASLKRKFRIWRCDIPRDNAPLSGDAALGVSRVKAHPIDRMRNPWLYIKLQKDADTDKKAEIHDMMMTYFT